MSTIRAITVTLLTALLAGGLAGCSKSEDSPRQKQTGLRVLCGTYPMYLFTRQVTAGCEDVTVELLLSAGSGCPHDYSLTPGDMRRLAAANVFIANGLGMETYLGTALRQANKTIAYLDTSTGIHPLPMSPASREHGADDEDDEDEEHDEDCDHDHGHAHELGQWNPHLFASPRMAARVVKNIADGLIQIDPANAERFASNARMYAQRLDTLADEMRAALADVPNRKIVTEHAVFDYLARDCGLEIIAVIADTPGQALSPAQLLALREQIQASGARAIFTEPKSLANPP